MERESFLSHSINKRDSNNFRVTINHSSKNI